MKKRLIVFGDMHLDWRATKVILDEARTLGIDTALTLGDEDHFVGGSERAYDALFGALRDYRDEKPERELICCVGDDTGGVRYIIDNYVGVDPSSRELIGSPVFRRGNIIAAHDGGEILKKYGRTISNPRRRKPLVIFHGHSHSMGVLPEYRWLPENEIVHTIPEGERTVQLEEGKVYWVNPGGWAYSDWGEDRKANFAIYDPENQIVVLRTKSFLGKEI